MMRKYALLGINILLLTRLAVAQDMKTLVAWEKVNYSRSFPKVLRAYIPKSGKSRFWGESKLKYQGKSVWVHVYDLRPTDFSKGREKYGARDYAPQERAFQKVPFMLKGYGVQNCGFDLFVQSKPLRWKRIASTDFLYQRYSADELKASFETIDVKTLWLDPRTRKSPIFKVNLCDPNGYVGAVGVEMLVVFPKGLDRGAVREGFGYGADNSSGHNYWSSGFNKVDECGFLTVTSFFGALEREKRVIYRWKGNYFRTFKVENKITGPF